MGIQSLFDRLQSSLLKTLKIGSGIVAKLSRMVVELLGPRASVRRPPETNQSHSRGANREQGAGMDSTLLMFCLLAFTHGLPSLKLVLMQRLCFRHCAIRGLVGPFRCMEDLGRSSQYRTWSNRKTMNFFFFWKFSTLLGYLGYLPESNSSLICYNSITRKSPTLRKVLLDETCFGLQIFFPHGSMLSSKIYQLGGQEHILMDTEWTEGCQTVPGTHIELC